MAQAAEIPALQTGQTLNDFARQLLLLPEVAREDGVKYAWLSLITGLATGVSSTTAIPAKADDLAHFGKGYALFGKLPEFVAPGRPFDAHIIGTPFEGIVAPFR